MSNADNLWRKCQKLISFACVCECSVGPEIRVCFVWLTTYQNSWIIDMEFKLFVFVFNVVLIGCGQAQKFGNCNCTFFILTIKYFRYKKSEIQSCKNDSITGIVILKDACTDARNHIIRRTSIQRYFKNSFKLKDICRWARLSSIECVYKWKH